MPVAHPPEFRQRAIELALLGGKPVSQIARDLGISDSCLRNWVRQADIDRGPKEGLTSEERAELVRLRRENRIQVMEIEILKRASALFARDNVLPKAPVPGRPSEHVVGHRHHRTLHQRRHGVLLRGARCVFADDRGLVNRRSPAHRLGR